MADISDMLQDIPDEFASKSRKQFYCELTKIRLSDVLEPALERAMDILPEVVPVSNNDEEDFEL